MNHGKTLDHLVVAYQFKHLSHFIEVQHGSSWGGVKYDPFFIKPRERFIGVEGWHHVFDGTRQLNALQFTIVNTQTGAIRKSPLFGEPTDTYFRFPPDPVWEIIAFWGNQGF